MNKAIATCALALACSAGVQAQTIYRCGSSFSQKPCEGAQALQIDSRRPSREEAAAAEANARRDARLADGLEKERLAQEKAAAEAQRPHTPKADIGDVAPCRHRQREGDRPDRGDHPDLRGREPAAGEDDRDERVEHPQ